MLDSVAGRAVDDDPTTHGFNLVEVDGASARVVTWDGDAVHVEELSPGTHMIAHDEVDDESTPRIARWLEDFRSAPLGTGDVWWRPWLDVLERTAELDSTDDAAIIRDNRPYGYPTLSLLACVASVDADGIDVRYGELSEPGKLEGLDLS